MDTNSHSDTPNTMGSQDIAKMCKALGHPARVRIVQELYRRQSCIGCDLVDQLGLAQSTTSEHLRILKQAGIIVGEIEHPRICYRLNDSIIQGLQQWLFSLLDAPENPESTSSSSAIEH
jgi:ArsR family transcriptional regulator